MSTGSSPVDICQWLWGDVTLGLRNRALEGNEPPLLCCFSTFGTFIQPLYWLKGYAMCLWRNLSIGTELPVRQNRLLFNSKQMWGDVKMLRGAFDSLLELWLCGGGTPECSCYTHLFPPYCNVWSSMWSPKWCRFSTWCHERHRAQEICLIVFFL